MSVIGQTCRIRINTGSVGTPDWKFIASEITLDLNSTTDKVPKLNKDSAKQKDYEKTFCDFTISCTAHEEATTAQLKYADVLSLSRKNFTDAGRGKYPMEIVSTVVGESSLAFTGFIENVQSARQVDALVEYNFNIQVTTEPVLTTVA